MANFPAALNEQVAREFAASQQYLAIAVHYDEQTLPNLAAHFYRQALEERNHAMMMVKYLLDAGEPVTVSGVQDPKASFKDVAEPVRLALEQERSVTEDIKRLAGIARGENDLVAEQFLHWFLQEQREEVASMTELLTTIERAQGTNILLVEDFLARTAVGDAGQLDAAGAV
jgi:ferritin